MLKFETEVRLNANAPPEQIVTRLALLTALPRTYTQPERLKPLRGRIALSNSFLRWPLYQVGRRSVRLLWFDLVPAPGGATLIGKFKLPKALRYGALGWLTLAYVVWSISLVRDLWHGLGSHVLLLDLRDMFIGTAMAIGYLWICKWFGRTAERQLIRVLRAALSSEQGTAMSSYLLSAFGTEDRNFVDPPLVTRTVAPSDF